MLGREQGHSESRAARGADFERLLILGRPMVDP